MSRAPYVMAKASTALDREQKLEDTTLGWRFVNPAMAASHGVDSMSQTAENLARELNISREDQDAFALRSQQRAGRAVATGRFAVGNHASGRSGSRRAAPARQHRGKLGGTPAASRPGHQLTAGNASGLNDGACALLLASETPAERWQLTPLARILGMAAAGVAPRTMGLGPVPAIERLLHAPGSCARAVRSHRNQRSLRRAGAGGDALAGPGRLCRAREPQRRRDRAGPSARRQRRAAGVDRDARVASGAARALVALCVGVGQGVALALERSV